MNSIANPTRLDRGVAGEMAISRRIAAGAATVLATAIFTLLIISFRPFQPAGAELEGGGDLLNQLGFGALGALALFGLLTLVDRRVVAALVSPWWLVLIAFLGVSVLTAASPPDAMRGVLFTLIGMLAIAAVLALPADAERFSAMLATTALIILALNYYGIFFKPTVAIHGSAGVEPQHAGLWRGSFTHKNAAAPVMAFLCVTGIYLWRRRWRGIGILIAALAVIFLAKTGSKTALGALPLTIFLVLLPSICGLRFLTPALVLAAVIGMGLATLGIVFIEPLSSLHQALVPDLTYTGRTTLWAFMGEKLAERPWLGYGFASFWGTDMVTLSDQPFDRAWDIRGIVHGHNSYLDLAITMGLPALLVALIVFILLPLGDFLRTPLLKENVLLSEYFLMIASFALLNGFLESFFFRRADPMWLLFVFALLGLRLTARFPISVRSVR